MLSAPASLSAQTAPPTAAKRADPAPATAATEEPKARPEARKLSPKIRRERIAAADQALRGSDSARAGAALDALVELGGADAGQVIAKRLQDGLPPALVERAVVALVMTHRRGAEKTLLELMHHRRPRIRASVVAALADARAPKARKVATESLADPAEPVRVAAARALGRLGSPSSVPALLSAYDAGLVQALGAIGEVATPRHVDPLLERIHEGFVTPLSPALDRMMERPRFSAPGKRKIIRAMADVASPTAKAFLLRWLEAWKVNGDPRLKNELFAALKRIDQAQREAARSVPEAAPKGGTGDAPAPPAAEPTSRLRRAARGGRS